MSLPALATITGKNVEHGGSAARSASTGLGGVEVLSTTLRYLEAEKAESVEAKQRILDKKKNCLKGKRVLLQGAGAVGRPVISELLRLEADVVGVSDHTGSVCQIVCVSSIIRI